MKSLVLIFCLFISCTSWSRGPVDPITPPWPLGTLPLNVFDFPGHWISVNANSIWILEIQMNSIESKRSDIVIRSNSNLLRNAKGWLIENNNVFVGQVSEFGHTFNIMIFKDENGTKLRIAGGNGYFDLKLFKGE